MTGAEWHPGGRVVVLGGGFLGAAVRREMLARGCHVDVLGRAVLDLTDPGHAARLAGLLDRETALVFTSAVTPDRDRSETAVRANAAMVETVARALGLAAPAACVFLSSSSVYGDGEGDRVITEDTAPHPSPGYAAGKFEGEGRLRGAASAAHVSLILLRPTVVYGPGDTHTQYGPSLLARGWRAGEVHVYEDGEDVRDFVYVDDVARVVATLLERGSEGVYNVSGESVSFLRVLELLAQLDPRSVRVLRKPRRVPLSRVTFDASRLRGLVPDHPLVSLEAGLRLTLDACARDGPGAS